jgi:8-oxo-dGTP diphosphatase
MQRPGVGVLVILQHNDKVLLGKRKGSHGHGEWSFPGGHLEMNETIEECGKREVFEETGINIINKLSISVDNEYTNDIFETEKKHYITLYQKYKLDELITPELLEPDKCFEWGWFDINNLPEPLFLCVKNYLINYTL